MTAIQRIAQVFGWAFVVMAIWGAAVSGMSMEADPGRAPAILGVFPVNFAHNLVHLLFGLWGIRAARSRSGARLFAVLAGAAYVVLALLGLFAPSGFGLVPLGGGDIWLHAGLGAALLVSGLVLADNDEEPRVEPAGTRTVMPPPEGPDHDPTDPHPPGDPGGPTDTTP